MASRDEFDAAKRAITLSHRMQTSICEPFLDILPVTSASVSVLVTPAGQTTVCASSDAAARIDELQFDLGEGPCWDALASHRPVFENDLAADPAAQWPLFGPAAATLVRGIYAFPMTLGSLDLGAVDLYSNAPMELTAEQMADAAELAATASWQVVRKIVGEESEASEPAYSRHEIHQATGMVLAQLDVSAEDALLLLRAHAFSSGRSMRAVARDVVERRFAFGSDETSGEL